MWIFLHKLHAFLRRGYLIESSYKAAFAFQVLKTLFPLISFYFIAKLVDQSHRGDDEARFPGGYFPFVLVGLALNAYFSTAVAMFAASIRRSQMSGVLEAMLSTQTSPALVVLLDSVFPFLMSSIQLVVVFGVAGTFLGVDYTNANLLATFVGGVLSLCAFAGFGTVSAAFVLTLKRGDPVAVFVTAAGALLSGAYFPLELLPNWVLPLSYVLPTTYALEALRGAIFAGAGIVELRCQLLSLATVAGVSLPLGLFAVASAVERGRRDGSLLHY